MTSLAIAALKLTKEALTNDLKCCGFLFELLVYHDVKMYATSSIWKNVQTLAI